MSTSSRCESLEVPKALFIENIPEFIAHHEESGIESLIVRFKEEMNKYRFVMSHLRRKRNSMCVKMEEIQKNLDILSLLAKGEKIDIISEMSRTIHVFTSVDAVETVFLWITSDIMVEYKIKEAVKLLTEKKETLIENMETIKNDLGFSREQLSVLEVNLARIYNHLTNRSNLQKEDQ